jgi:hypothetical protein
MDEERVYQILQPETRETGARVFRVVHHAMVAAGIGIMLADTLGDWREAYADALDAGFQIVCAFFFAEYALRLAAAPGAPGAAHRGKWVSRLAWATSLGGTFDFLGALPGVIDIVFNPRFASLFGFIWAFKLVRYSPGGWRASGGSSAMPGRRCSRFFSGSASFCCWRQAWPICWSARPSPKFSARSRRRCGGRSLR